MIKSDLASTAAQELRSWVEQERLNGLIDIKFFKANTENSTVESFCKEVLEMIKAPQVEDPDFI